MKIISPLPFVRRLRRDRSGAAAVEFGLVAPMLVALLVPMVDLGMGTYNKMRVQDAAEAGAQYALSHGYSTSSITSAAQNATSLGATVSVTPSEACGCITATGTVDTSSYGSPPCTPNACSDGSTPGTFVGVATQTTYTPLLAPTTSLTLNGTAVVRIN